MKKALLLISIIFLGFTSSYATHLMGAEITYTHVGGNDYEVTLIVYRDCSGVNLSTTSQNVDFESASCGQNFNQNCDIFPMYGKGTMGLSVCVFVSVCVCLSLCHVLIIIHLAFGTV